MRLPPVGIHGVQKMSIGKLSAIAVKQAKPADKPYKMTDGGGMYLLIDVKGGKYWRMNYRFAGKRKTLANHLPATDC